LLLSPFSIQTSILLCLGNNHICDRQLLTTFQLTKRDRPSSSPKNDRPSSFPRNDRLSLSPKSDHPLRSYPKQWQF
jgi:hypothetical protein